MLNPILANRPGELWAIAEGWLEAVLHYGLDRPVECAAARAKRTPTAEGVAVIPIHGMVTHRGLSGIEEMFFGAGTSTVALGHAVDSAVADASIGAIVLDIDSPGGTVTGVMEAADKIFQARGSKPVVALANGLAASAAYWLGSQASEFYAIPSGQVGSIGVRAMHIDQSVANEAMGVKVTSITSSKFKDEGSPHAPLSDEARDEIQRRVDAVHGEFVAAVARGRGVTAGTVNRDFGQGRVVSANDAKNSAMIDGVATAEAVISKIMARREKGRPTAMAARQIEALKLQCTPYSLS